MKRFFDIIFSLIFLILFSPLFIFIVLAIKLFDRGPVFYRAPRVGKGGTLFRMFKFRTMVVNADRIGGSSTADDDPRITRVGKWLRKSKLDEFPQLFNVLLGDMSIVGPRPLLKEYLKLYTPEQARRHEVKPGITGWAQVNGRNAITWEQKFKFDVRYVDNWNLWLDLKIIIMTIILVLKAEGINQPGQATMEKFQGDNRKS